MVIDPESRVDSYMIHGGIVGKASGGSGIFAATLVILYRVSSGVLALSSTFGAIAALLAMTPLSAGIYVCIALFLVIGFFTFEDICNSTTQYLDYLKDGDEEKLAGMIEYVSIRRDHIMRCLGNIIWLIFGGFISGMGWILSGLLCCCTIIGIPLGLQCFKFTSMGFCPFGKEIEYGGGTVSLIANVAWLVFCGVPMAVENVVNGCLLCITIIGIPFGLQYFKLAKLALMPFGATITYHGESQQEK